MKLHCLAVRFLYEFPRNPSCLMELSYSCLMGFSQGFCLSYSCLMEFLGRGRCFLQAGGYSSRRASKAQAEPIQAKQGWESACEGDRAGKARRCKEKPNTPCQCTFVAHNPTLDYYLRLVPTSASKPNAASPCLLQGFIDILA